MKLLNDLQKCESDYNTIEKGLEKRDNGSDLSKLSFEFVSSSCIRMVRKKRQELAARGSLKLLESHKIPLLRVTPARSAPVHSEVANVVDP